MRPVYEIINYQLVNVVYNRLSNGFPETMKLFLKASDFNEEQQIYTIYPVLEIKFKESEPSIFQFQSSYRINQIEWMNSINRNQLDAILFASIFPFIRSTVHHITDDYRGAINLPIMDLRMVNFQTGITFNITNKNEFKRMNN